jgi:hypothetical protein
MDLVDGLTHTLITSNPLRGNYMSLHALENGTHENLLASITMLYATRTLNETHNKGNHPKKLMLRPHT